MSDCAMPDAVARAYAAVGCHRVVLQAMIGGDLEAIAGVTRADGVGLVLIAGLGGIFAEALHDVVDVPAAGRAGGSSRLGWRRAASGACWPARGGNIQAASAAFVDLLMSLQDAALSLGDATARDRHQSR